MCPWYTTNAVNAVSHSSALPFPNQRTIPPYMRCLMLQCPSVGLPVNCFSPVSIGVAQCRPYNSHFHHVFGTHYDVLRGIHRGKLIVCPWLCPNSSVIELITAAGSDHWAAQQGYAATIWVYAARHMQWSWYTLVYSRPAMPTLEQPDLEATFNTIKPVVCVVSPCGAETADDLGRAACLSAELCYLV